MSLTAEEADYAYRLTPDLFWIWFAEREEEG